MKVSIYRVMRFILAAMVLSFLTGYVLLHQSETGAVHARQISPEPSANGFSSQSQLANSGFCPSPNPLSSTGKKFSDNSESPSVTAATFCNAARINVPDGSSATPYPSAINVSGQTGLISNLTVTLNGFNHFASSNISVLLVGPTGQKMILFSQAGGAATTNNSTLTFDDAATAHLPLSGALTTGSYKPSNYAGVDVGFEPVFPAPAPGSTPASPYRSTLTAFNQSNPNGTWNLYVIDSNADGSDGSINTGWCLNITTTTGSPRNNQFILFQGSLTAGDTAQTGRLQRNNVVSETDNGKGCPGTFGTDSLVYDTYSITNQNNVAVPVTVTTSSACGMNVFASAYAASYSPAAGFCNNYLADAGTSPGTVSGAGPAFSFVINPNQTVQLIANNINAGTFCSSYSLLVEGNLLNPSAAGSQVGGSVTAPNGGGLSNAFVKATDSQGNAKTVRTNAFGKFNFVDLKTGQTYVIEVTSKQYKFTPQVVNLTENAGELKFVAGQ